MADSVVTNALAAQAGTKIRAAQEILSLAKPASGRDEFALFKTALPAESKPYAEMLYAASLEYGIAPILLWGIMNQESKSGLALIPRGPGGMSADKRDLGLMQLNTKAQADWLKTHDWRDPLGNIYRGAAVLYSNYQYFRRAASQRVKFNNGRTIGEDGVTDPRPLSGLVLTRAALAAYNAGPGEVLWAVATGKDPDAPTTPAKLGQGGYSQLILTAVATMSQTLFKKGSIFGSTDALAVVVASPVSSGAMGTVYRDIYTAFKAQERSATVAATTRVDFYAEAAAWKVRECAAAHVKKVETEQAAAIHDEETPAFKDDGNLAALSYDFERGTWGRET